MLVCRGVCRPEQQLLVLFPRRWMRAMATASAPPSGTPPTPGRTADDSPASAPPSATQRPHAADPHPTSKSQRAAARSAGEEDGINADIVRLAADTLTRMHMDSPQRSTTPGCAGAAEASGGSPRVADHMAHPCLLLPMSCGRVPQGRMTLEQAKQAVVQALGKLAVRDTGPFLAFLEDLVQNQYAHVLSQYHAAVAQQPQLQPLLHLQLQAPHQSPPQTQPPQQLLPQQNSTTPHEQNMPVLPVTLPGTFFV